MFTSTETISQAKRGCFFESPLFSTSSVFSQNEKAENQEGQGG
jgi:hypothetical protein